MKRVLSIVLCVVMVLSMTVAAEGSKSFSSTSYAESRANVVVMLYNLHEQLVGPTIAYKNNPFSDIRRDSSYYDAILWAAYNGIVNGYEDGTFRPNNGVTREQMCTMLYRFAQKECLTLKQDCKTATFEDADSIGSWATDAVEYCQKAGIITGYEDGTFKPQKSISRAETITVIYRFENAII